MSEIFGNTTTTPINPNLFGGGGGNITVDKIYDPTSENAQSGKAVAEAVNELRMLHTNVYTFDLSSYSPAGNYYIRNGVQNTSSAWESYEINAEDITRIKYARLGISVAASDQATICAVSFYNSKSISSESFMTEESILFKNGIAESSTIFTFENISIPKNCKMVVISNRKATLGNPSATIELEVSKDAEVPKASNLDDGTYRLFAYRKGNKTLYYWEPEEIAKEFYECEVVEQGGISLNNMFCYETLYEWGHQDGAIYKGFLVGDTGTGIVKISDITTGKTIKSYRHDKIDLLKPHANSVSIVEIDNSSYMYSNVYNSYSGQEDEHKGECCVYKMLAFPTIHHKGIEFELGSIASSNGINMNASMNDRYRTGFISLDSFSSVVFDMNQMIVFCYDSDETYIGRLSVDGNSIAKSLNGWMSAGTIVTKDTILGINSSVAFIRVIANTSTTPTDGTFTFEEPSDVLTQIIKIGFINDATLWTVTDSRPYGNFVVDSENEFLYAYVLDNATNSTKWHKFNLPPVTDGNYDSTYGCYVKTLTEDDIIESWTTSYATFIQGACCHNGKIWITHGGGEVVKIMVVDLHSKKEVAIIDLKSAGITIEPEFIDFNYNTCYFASLHTMYKIRFV